MGATLRLGRVFLQDVEASRADAASPQAMPIFSTQIEPGEGGQGGQGRANGVCRGGEEVGGAVGGDFLTASSWLFDPSAPDYSGWHIESRVGLGGLVAVVSPPFVNALNSWMRDAVCGRGEAPSTVGISGGGMGRSAPRGRGGATWHADPKPLEPQEQHPAMASKSDLTVASLDLLLVSVDQGHCRRKGLLRAKGLSAQYRSGPPPSGTLPAPNLKPKTRNPKPETRHAAP